MTGKAGDAVSSSKIKGQRSQSLGLTLRMHEMCHKINFHYAPNVGYRTFIETAKVKVNMSHTRQMRCNS